MKTEIFNSSDIDIFHQPARIIIAGSSNSGKTQLATKLVLKYADKFHTIIICGVTNHELESSIVSNKLIVSEDIINPFEYVHHKNKSNGILYILDDCFLQASEDKNVVNVFTKGRHSNISVILITQNLFFRGKHSRNIALNASHYLLTKIRDIGQVEILGRQIFGKKNGNEFGDIYKRAISMKKYGYLLVDIAANTPEQLQLRTNIVEETLYETVYQI